jgi:hypothetical protein
MLHTSDRRSFSPWMMQLVIMDSVVAGSTCVLLRVCP